MQQLLAIYGVQVEAASRGINGIGQQQGEEDPIEGCSQYTSLFDTTVGEEFLRSTSLLKKVE